MVALGICNALAERLQTAFEESVSLAVDLMEKRQIGEAIAAFESLLKADEFEQFPTKKYILYNLAWCYIEQRQYDDAIPLLERVTREHAAQGIYSDDSLLCDSYLALAKCHENRALYREYKRMYGDQAAEVLSRAGASCGRPALRLVK